MNEPQTVIDDSRPIKNEAHPIANKRQLHSLTAFTLSVMAFLALWWIASYTAKDPLLLPSPVQVAQTFWYELTQAELLYHLGITLGRVAVAFVISMLAGVFIGCFLGHSTNADRLLDPWLIFFLHIPALVVMILCYLWIGLTEVAAVTAVCINKIPNVAVIMREGYRTLDPSLTEMANSFQISRYQKFKHLVFPQLSPYLFASVRSGIALIWKIVLVVELLGRSNGIGFQLHLFFQLFEVDALIAYAIAFIAVMQAIEFLVLKPWERKLNRWRATS